ncbi:pseudouridylate synthase PUS7L [Trichomycterus rosablanca]|uniref:pseudouridylate synthase PUS7L n=1 Tax=Trichomycterus rosablanca TaxID=2290929 RepID=UPI002F35241A
MNDSRNDRVRMDPPKTASLPCMITEHEGFYGTIKNFTQDFVVIEIDMKGQRVNKECTVVAPTKLDTSENVKGSHKDSVIGELPSDKTCSNETAGGTSSAKNNEADNEYFDLNVILGSSVNKALEHFILKIPECSKEQPKMEMSIGSFPDKIQRASVHRSVRYNYPFLMTITNQTEILVKEDKDFKDFLNLVSEEEAEDFFRFKDAKVLGSTFTFLPDANKEHRTSVHHFISSRFGKLVETKSFTAQGGTCITVRLRERGRPAKKRPLEDCEDQVNSYTAFTLRKENLETLEAISYIAAVLGVLPSDFSYAGIKDKRAITYQSMAMKKISPDRLLEKVFKFEKRGIQLSNIHPVSEPLRLGGLKGNHFDLVIRNLKPHNKSNTTDLKMLVKDAVDNVKALGFVNYYGPQRFGNSKSIQADQVGLALLKEDMGTALKLFLNPETGDDLQNKAKQHFRQTGNAKESLALMPPYKARERLMLRALHRYGSGPEGCSCAWLSLPHSMRVFYVHAYCSRVWNEAASFRLETLGLKPAQGDLVWTRGASQKQEECHGLVVHVVTSAEECEGVFSLDQVVLPSPGNSVKYPENLLGKWYQDRLAQDGLDSCRFRIGSLKLNIPGCYRPLLSFPHNVSFNLHPQKPPSTELLTPESNSVLELSFDLDSSCYATVCLREIMKCDI